MEDELSDKKAKDIAQIESILSKPKQYWIYKSCCYGLGILSLWAVGYKLMMKLTWDLAITSAIPIALAFAILLPAAEFWFSNILLSLKRGDKLDFAKSPGNHILLKAILAAFILESIALVLLNKFVW